MAKILLADNDPKDLHKWSGFLRREGHEVVTASSPSTADELLNNGDLDLAILDLHMETTSDSSDLSGMRLAERHGGSVVIILLTGLLPADAALLALNRYGGSSSVYKVCLKVQGPKPLLQAIQEITVPTVFLSHGRDLGTLEHVRRFLEDGGIKVIVLREKAGQGQTIFQKFDQYSHVSCAIVLVTPDDMGALKGEDLRPRARQNVIFELGFFLGKLDRRRVITLCQGRVDSIDFPSNYAGFHKIEIDPRGGWCVELAREFDGAGIRFDLKKALLRR